MRTNHWNTPVATLFLLSSSLFSFNSLAADSAQFKIKGKFLPSTCNISLSRNEINLGNIHYGALTTKVRANTRFMGKLLIKDVSTHKVEELTKVKVDCDSTASAGFTITDNYKNYSPWNLLGTDIRGEDLSNSFGLKPVSGMKSAGKLGGYFFDFINPKSKGHQGSNNEIFYDTVLKDSKISAIAWIKRATLGRSDLSKYWEYNNEPDKSAHFEVEFKPILYFFYDSEQRDMNDEITFEGSSTFTVFYI